MTTVTMAKKVCAWCRLDMGIVPWSTMTRDEAPPVTTTWYQALLRLDFATQLPEFASFEFTEVAP